MKKSYKLVLINIILALGLSVLIGLSFKDGSVFMLALGIISISLGFLSLVIGLILLATEKKEWSQAFLISSGVSFLLGFGICGSMFIFMM